VKRLRVLHVIGGLQLGGTETLLYNLIKRPSEFDHQVVSLAGRDWYSDKLEALHVRVEHLDIDSPLDALTGIPRLWSFVSRSDADLVQTWMYRSNLLGGLAARLSGRPVVWGNHSARLDAAGWSSRLSARIGGWLAPSVADFVINCSDRTAAFHAAMGYARAPNGVIFNGVDSERFHVDDTRRDAIREAFGLEPGTFVIGTLARFAPQKDIPTLLRAVRIAADSAVPLAGLIAGRGLDGGNGQLVEDIRASGCDGLVRLLGPRTDVADVARAFDLHLLSSRFESFGNVVAETMLSGVPNASTDVGEAASMIGDSGWVVEPGDAEGLAEAIVEAHREWSQKPLDWQRRRKRSRKQILDRFTLDQMSKNYEAVWRQVARVQ